MEDKILDLIEKLYIEVQSMKGSMATKEDMALLKQDIVLLEDKMDRNHKALYDGYKLTYEKLGYLEEKVDGIEQDVEIRVIKGGANN